MKHYAKKSDFKKTSELFRARSSTKILDGDYRKILDDALHYNVNDNKIVYDEKYLEAIMVNGIRHNLSNYNKINRSVDKIYRSNRDHHQYRNSVLERISNQYEFLKDECNRQKHSINMINLCK